MPTIHFPQDVLLLVNVIHMKPRDCPSKPSSFTGRISCPRRGARERLKSCGNSHLTCTYM